MIASGITVLGLDPGIAPTGWGLVRRAGGRTSYLAHGVLRTDPSADDHARVQELARALGELLAAHRPDLVAIERWVHYGQSESTQAHGLGLVIGALVAACGAAGVPTASLSRAQDWRHALGLPGSATKTEAQERVRAALGLAAVVRPQHASDALAVAMVAALKAPAPPPSPATGAAALRLWAGRGEARMRLSPKSTAALRTALGSLGGAVREVAITLAGVRLVFSDRGDP